MDIGTISAMAGSAGGGALLYKLGGKLIEKFPWGRLFGRNGKNGKAVGLTDVDRDQIQLLIADHKEHCSVSLRQDINNLGEKLEKKHEELQTFILEHLLDRRD